MYIKLLYLRNVSAYLFTIVFGFVLGAVFAWVVFYRWLHKNPTGIPKRLTETNPVPQAVQGRASITQRLILEKANLEKEQKNKYEFMQRLVTVFYGRLCSYSSKILSVCFWEKEAGGYRLAAFHSSYKIRENIFLPKDFYLFEKKVFFWSKEAEESPLDFYASEDQVVRSVMGTAVSGNGSVWGYITMDSTEKNAFDDSIELEIKGVAEIASIAMNSFKDCMSYQLSNAIFSEIIQVVSEPAPIISKDNALHFISGILGKYFHSNRAMIITVDDNLGDKSYCISAITGENQNELKRISFKPQENTLFYELLELKAQRIIRGDLQDDPYVYRFYGEEPKNLDLKSIIAVSTLHTEGVYPLVIALESRESHAYSALDEKLLTYIASNVGKALAVLQKQTENTDYLSGFNSNGLGNFLSYFIQELKSIKKSREGFGILLLSVNEYSGETGWQKDFFDTLNYQKESWKTHLAMFGLYDFLFVIKNNENTVTKLDENTFQSYSEKLVELLKKNKLELSSRSLWINAQRMEEKEKFYSADYFKIFSLYVFQQFEKMSKEKFGEN